TLSPLRGARGKKERGARRKKDSGGGFFPSPASRERVASASEPGEGRARAACPCLFRFNLFFGHCRERAAGRNKVRWDRHPAPFDKLRVRRFSYCHQRSTSS